MTEINSVIDIESPEFFDFINREFEKIVVHATIEDLAEFAFGSIEDAVSEFIKFRAE
jgi:hypothetical protein